MHVGYKEHQHGGTFQKKTEPDCFELSLCVLHQAIVLICLELPSEPPAMNAAGLDPISENKKIKHTDDGRKIGMAKNVIPRVCVFTC